MSFKSVCLFCVNVASTWAALTSGQLSSSAEAALGSGGNFAGDYCLLDLSGRSDEVCSSSRQSVAALALLQRSAGTSKVKRPALIESPAAAGVEEHGLQSEALTLPLHGDGVRPDAKAAPPVSSVQPALDRGLSEARQAIAFAAEGILLHAVPRHRVQSLDSVAVEVKYNGLMEEMLTFPERRPWAFNIIMATAKTAGADILVQAGDKQRGIHGINWRRTLFFAVFGCVYIGMVQWFFYVNVFSMLCPDALTFANKPLASKLTDREGQMDLVLQVIVDQFLITPFIYFPTFYIVKEAFFGSLQPHHAVLNAMSTYKGNFVQDNLASMSLWFPADFVIFTVPMYLRMPLDHLVAFGWTMVISSMRGGTVPTTAATAK